MQNERKQKKKIIVMNGITRNFIVGIMVLACMVLLVLCGYAILRNVGKQEVYKRNDILTLERIAQKLNDIPIVPEASENEDVITEEYQVTELEPGQIYYNGEVWQYNEEILTFLFLGIDATAGVADEKIPGKAGQSDVVVLLVANPHTKQINVININRDSMVEIKRYDTDGNYIGVMEGQLALQYAYGDGRQESCESTRSVVEELFYGIPIHGYAALDMQCIATINDAVGGVEVTVMDDMTWADKSWKKGTKLHLMGNDALKYIRKRNYTSAELGTNINRIERQKQYLTLFADKLKSKTKENLAFPVTLYSKVEGHLVSSFSVSQITYLAGELLDYNVTTDSMVSVEGRSAMGEKYEEFYIDEEALKELIITTFYEKVS